MTVKRIVGALATGIGFLLSPLSWWNDIIINIPLAYGFGSLFGLLSKNLFFPMMIVGYWLTNIAGMLLMHHGARMAMGKSGDNDCKKQILVSIGYTILIMTLVGFGILRFPTEYFR